MDRRGHQRFRSGLPRSERLLSGGLHFDEDRHKRCTGARFDNHARHTARHRLVQGKGQHDRKTQGNHQGCDHDSGQLGIAVNCRARNLPVTLVGHRHDVRVAAVPVRVEHAGAVGRHRESGPRVIADPRDIHARAARERRAPHHRLIGRWRRGNRCRWASPASSSFPRRARRARASAPRRRRRGSSRRRCVQAA